MTSLTSINDHIPNVLIKKFNCVVCYNNSYFTNKFKVKIGFMWLNENPVLNEIALDQVKIFFNALIKDCIITDKETYETWENPPTNNVLMLKEKPDDQTIACMFYSKLSSIVKNNLIIDYVKVSSKLGNGIVYTIDSESDIPEALLPTKEEWWGNKDIKFDPWWMRSDSATYDKIINDEEIFEGEFLWGELFKDEFEEANKYDLPTKEKFKLIPGGKNDS